MDYRLNALIFQWKLFVDIYRFTYHSKLLCWKCVLLVIGLDVYIFILHWNSGWVSGQHCVSVWVTYIDIFKSMIYTQWSAIFNYRWPPHKHKIINTNNNNNTQQPDDDVDDEKKTILFSLCIGISTVENTLQLSILILFSDCIDHITCHIEAIHTLCSDSFASLTVLSAQEEPIHISIVLPCDRQISTEMLRNFIFVMVKMKNSIESCIFHEFFSISTEICKKANFPMQTIYF